MELGFQEQRLSCLTEKRFDDLHQELTGELSIPETLPPLGRVVDCFGTVLVQERRTENGSVTVSGGIQAGVLYVPEGEEPPERLELRLPFKVTKKLALEPGVQLLYRGWIRSMEARFVNSRKLLLRVSLGSQLRLLSPTELRLAQLEQRPRGLVCKTETFPLRLPLCVAEKETQLADEVLMPEEGPGAERLLKAQCGVELREQRILGDKLVFQGSLALRVLFQTEDGALSAWSGAVPFSQYAELDRPLEESCGLSLTPILTRMEIDTDGQPDSHRLLINVSFLTQALVWGDSPVKLTQDAYYLEGSFTPQWESLDLSPCLDRMETDLSQSLELPREAASVLDWTLTTEGILPGQEAAVGALSVNVLYLDEERRLQSRLLRQELRLERQANPEARWECSLRPGTELSCQGGRLRIPVTVEQCYCQAAALRNLCGGSLNPEPRPEGPSLLVRGCAGDLWTVAKENGSSLESLRAANGLEGDSLPREQLLLIPVGRGVITVEEGKE